MYKHYAGIIPEGSMVKIIVNNNCEAGNYTVNNDMQIKRQFDACSSRADIYRICRTY